MRSAWEWFRGTKWWAKTLMVVGVLAVIGAIVGEDPEDQAQSDEPETVAEASATEPDTTEKPEPKPKPPSAREELRSNLANVDAIGEDPEIKEVNFLEGRTLNVIAETPEGGFQGPSTTDLNYMSRAIFEAIYGPSAPQHKFGTVIEFTGGLVNSKTGKDLPNAVTARYIIERSEARDIDWSDKDTLDFINWSLYRTFTHPAIKDDD